MGFDNIRKTILCLCLRHRTISLSCLPIIISILMHIPCFYHIIKLTSQRDKMLSVCHQSP
jgi:hypothetical protein